MNVQNKLPQTGTPGEIIVTADGKKFICAYYDGAAPGSSVAKGQPVALSVGTTNGTKVGPKIIAIATSTLLQQIIFATAALSAAGWYWFQMKGDFDNGLVTHSTSISAAGKWLKVAAAGATTVYDGSTQGAQCVAVSREATTSGLTAADIYIIGDPVIISA